MDSIDFSRLSIANASPLESEQGNLGDASPLSPKLKDKLNKLAKWRIDPSLIEFPEGTPKFEGGHATVSRALLTPASAAEADLNESRNMEGGSSPHSGPINKKIIAVKKMKTENENSLERVLELALREAGLLVELSHGHIITLEGFVEDLPNGRIWLIFPWEEHGNLKDFVASQDWEIPERISLITDVTYGVQYLHSRDPPLLHGDLKSINVLVNSRCRAVITDFGSVRRLANNDVDPQMQRTEKKEAKPPPDFHASFCATSNTMTFTGNEYTLRWAAPELLMDDERTLSSDIWALGWIYYEVMTNSVPFEDVQKDSIVIKHVVDGRLPCVTDHVRVSLILQLSALMVKCWNVNPTKRPTVEDCRKALNWMPTVLPVPQRGSDPASSRARSPDLLMKLGNMYTDQGDSLNASNLYTEALGIYSETSDNPGKASALGQLGQVHALQGNFSKAATLYTEALQIYTDISNRQGRAYALLGLATARSNLKEYSKAIMLYSEVIQLSIDPDDQTRKAYALRGLSEVHRFQEDYSQAVIFASEAVEIHTSVGSLFGRANALWYLAEAHRCQNNYTQAIPLFFESLTICTDIGDKFGTANALLCLADIHLGQDQHGEAIRLYEQAAEIFKQIGNTRKAETASTRAARSRGRLEAAGNDAHGG